MNRRAFLALTGAACFSIGHAATLPRAIGKGRRIRMALVGCGNRGVNNLLQEMVKEQVVAFADPNVRNLESALAKLRQLDPTIDTAKVKTFRDYREMFDKASTDFAYGAPLVDLTALVNVAQRAGCKKLLWDGCRVTNDAEANAFVSMSYRNGWALS